VIFEEFGFRYYGPIDGHDIPLLIKTFEFLKGQNEPVLLHIITEKGRGYKPALDDPGKFHGLGKYNIETGETQNTATPTFSQIFARSVTDFAKEDKKIVAITAAMPAGRACLCSRRNCPSVTTMWALPKSTPPFLPVVWRRKGLRPFLTIYSTFMQRAIRHDHPRHGHPEPARAHVHGPRRLVR
jgi:1-deoxy-D-xylulose-5-phosphate synthase